MKNINFQEVPELLRNVDYLNNHFYDLKEKLNNPYLKILHNIFVKELKINLNYQKINKEINNSLNSSVLRKKI